MCLCGSDRTPTSTESGGPQLRLLGAGSRPLSPPLWSFSPKVPSTSCPVLPGQPWPQVTFLPAGQALPHPAHKSCWLSQQTGPGHVPPALSALAAPLLQASRSPLLPRANPLLLLASCSPHYPSLNHLPGSAGAFSGANGNSMAVGLTSAACALAASPLQTGNLRWPVL